MRLSLDVRKSWFSISLIACFAITIFLLMFLDYFNLEKIAYFNDTGFFFELTWKGRLFLFFFLWLFVLASISKHKSLEEIMAAGRKSRFRLLLILVCALIPLIYILGVNFLGWDQAITSVGDALRGEYWKANTTYYENSLMGDWPLTLEYLVFAFSFLITVFLAYGRKGLKVFSLSAAIVVGTGIIYLVDTMYPAGTFTPLQALALPTVACASILLEFLGFNFYLTFTPASEAMPVIVMNIQGNMVPTHVAWPYAGVHSLFLYTVFILLFFGNSNIAGFRKAIYFVVGLVGTFFVNVLRIVTYFVLLVGPGRETALTFHGVYGELYFFTWMLGYLLLILGIQRYSIVERLERIFLRSKQAAGSTK